MKFTLNVTILLIFSSLGTSFIYVDPFHKVTEFLKVPDSGGLNTTFVDELMGRLFHRFNCSSCDYVCLRSNDIFNVLGIADNDDLLEKDFGSLSSILTYHILNVDSFCHQNVSINPDLSFYKQGIHSHLANSQSKIILDKLQSVLENIDDVYESEEEHDNGDGTNDHSDDMDQTDGHDDEHSDETTTHGSDSDDDHTESVETNHSDDDSDDHDHSQEEHENEVQVIQAKCLSAGVLFDEMDKNPEKDSLDIDNIDDISSLLIYHFLTGASIKSNCRLLPRKYAFPDNLMTYMNAVNDTITEIKFKELMTKLGITSDSIDDSHDDHGHRAKRDLTNVIRFSTHNSRQKRSTTTSTQASFQDKCYSADQLLAIYNSQTGSVISRQKFLEMCPSLIYQQVSGACQSADKTSAPTTSDAQRYGYGTVAVFIICLCSILAVLVVPFAKHSTTCFNFVMNVFLGLAVGTLTTDAFLHLLPSAFGLHNDEEGHAHGDAFMEDYVGFGLAALAGVYGFYIMEVIMSFFRKGIHSSTHSHLPYEIGETNFSNGHVSESKHDLYNSKSDMGSTVEFEERKSKGLTSLGLMVLIGDGIHNFADGLAIGAAFTQSISVGLATSITVLCHELPHELGDFAILIKSGLSMKAALLLNLLSALTAFVGLYVGNAVSTDYVVRQWIFAVTAGLFIYIALVDMLPELINGHRGSMSNKIVGIIQNNVGMVVGALILFLLSVYEEQISV